MWHSVNKLQGGSIWMLYLAICVFVLEALPQAAQLLIVLLHWHGPVDTISIELFCTAVNVPLRNHDE